MKYCVDTDKQVFKTKTGDIVRFACAIEALKEAAARRYYGDIYRTACSTGGFGAARKLHGDYERALAAIEVVRSYLKV